MDGIVNTKIRSVEDLIGNLLPPILRESVRKNDLLVKVADTQLSPTKAQWIEAKRAVNSFAGDLNT